MLSVRLVVEEEIDKLDLAVLIAVRPVREELMRAERLGRKEGDYNRDVNGESRHICY